MEHKENMMHLVEKKNKKTKNSYIQKWKSFKMSVIILFKAW